MTIRGFLMYKYNMANRGLLCRMMHRLLKNRSFVAHRLCRSRAQVLEALMALVGQTVLEHVALYRRKDFALLVAGVLLLGAKWVARSSNNRGFYVLV
jgi:hypothetical protein